MNNRVCTVDRCSEPCVARGLCWKHYGRQRRYGSVEFLKRRYKMPPKCRYCGATKPQSFYKLYKSICKHCKKLKAVHRGN